MEEKEIKIQVSNTTFEKLLEMAKSRYDLVHGSDQRDVYFDTDKMLINNLNRGLRIRFDDGKAKTLEFKSLFYNKNARKDNPWFIEEVAFPLPLKTNDFDKLQLVFSRLGLMEIRLTKAEYSHLELKDLFEQLGLTPKITVTKHRQVYKCLAAEFIYDFIEELGYFVEIETKDGSDPIELMEDVIGEEQFRFIRNGYNDMVAIDIPFCLSNDTKQQLFKINPKWNVLESEVALVNELTKRQM